MSLASPTARNAGPPDDSADLWVIAPDASLGSGDRLREVWRYRRILGFFATRAVQSLYRDTRLGPLWLVLRPAAPVLVGSLVFGKVMGVPSLGVPYFLFFLAGSIAWSMFAEPVVRGSRALEINRQLLTKLYLPRLILPAGQLAAGVTDPLVLIGVFGVALCYFRWTEGIWYLAAPERLPAAAASLLATLVFAFGATLWTSVWQARARDVRYLIGYVLSFWFFLTPCIYPLSMVPANLQWAAALNPMTAPVETLRWALLGVGTPTVEQWAVSSAAITATLTLGLWHFSLTENQTIDKL